MTIAAYPAPAAVRSTPDFRHLVRRPSRIAPHMTLAQVVARDLKAAPVLSLSEAVRAAR